MRPKSSSVKGLLDRPIALTVAGFDPSSGAGVTADLETFWNHGIDGVSAITALTVQSTRGVRRVEPVTGQLLRETLDGLAEDLPDGLIQSGGVKIGMLGTAELVGVMAEWLRGTGFPRERVVLDPVLRSSSGAELLEAEGVRRVVEELLQFVGWVTPNVSEAGVLVGADEPGRAEVPGVAERLAGLGAGVNVVVTGGHLEPPDDFLRTVTGEERWFPGRRVEARGRHGSHGTGCAFSSALLCRLLLGDGAAEAVAGAKDFVVRRLGTGRPGGGASRAH